MKQISEKKNNSKKMPKVALPQKFNRKEDVHLFMMYALDQVLVHKSTSKVLQILEVMPNGISKDKILRWIEAFMPVEKVSDDPINFKVSIREVKPRIEASAFPYWKFETPPQPVSRATTRSDSVKALNAFFSDPSDSNYDELTRLLRFYQRYSTHPAGRAFAHKPAVHLQGGKMD